jgi:NodT family efflux transporter outer membrane factor (OMF) lipoprotein
MTRHRIVGIAIGTACALALTACSVGPNYHRSSAPPSPVFKSGQGWTPATPAQVTSAQWWSIYNDPTLSGLEAQVEVSNQNVKAAVANYYAAREAAAVDESGFLPQITLGGTATHSGGEGQYSTDVSGFQHIGSTTRTVYEADANASWDIDIWGKLRREVESDIAKAQADAADIAAARLSAQNTLAADYFQLRAAEQEMRILKTTVQEYKVSLKIAQNQVNAGTTTLADVYSARTQLEDTIAQENSVELTRDEMEHAIAVLVGKAPSQLAVPAGDFTSTVPVVPVGLPSQLLLRRPDIAASERALQSANAQIGVAEAAWFPTLTLTGSYGYESSSLSSLIRASNNVWSFGPSLAETLFNAGATYAQTKEERALYDSAVASYRETVLTAFQQVENDLATLRHLQTEYAQDNAAVVDAEKSATLTLNQYRAGTVAYTSVIVADTTLFNAQITALTVQSQRLVASADLVDAIGGDWDSAQLKAHDEGVTESLKSTVEMQ